jgi:hypothetical protein
MTNPTSNFGWQMPEPTDLVTNLPADFEVFGQAVDTDFVDLLGGTTGQVLKKNTNADLDFVWAADSAGMTNPMTTTGDIIYSSPGSTPVRLGIGSASQVLTVASGVPSWETPAASASGLTLISTTAFTTTPSLSLNSIFSATYTNYRVIINLTSAASDGGMRLRLRVGGTDATGSNYLTRNIYIDGNSTVSAAYSTQTSSFIGSADAAGNIIITDFLNPYSTKFTYITGQNLSGTNSQMNGLVHNLANSYDGFTLYNTGSVNMTGTVSVYGYQI